jgi:hypothetical protein
MENIEGKKRGVSALAELHGCFCFEVGDDTKVLAQMQPYTARSEKNILANVTPAPHLAALPKRSKAKYLLPHAHT